MVSNCDDRTLKAFEPTELTLSCEGLNYVNWDRGDADFEFVTGDGRMCRVHSVLAEFLSPKVARLRRCDISFDVYTLKDSELFDGSSWTEIDRRDNNNDLNDSRVTVNFKISKAPSESFRFFRLRQTGENHLGHYLVMTIMITAVEIFVTLFEK